MQKLGLRELNAMFEDWLEIIFDIKLCIDNMQRLSSTNEKYELDVLKKLGFFKFAYRQFRFVIVVNLCKIFSESSNQKKSLHILFKKLRDSPYSEDLLGQFERNAKKPFTNSFKSKEELIIELDKIEVEVVQKTELINRVVKLRDKYYAHADAKKNLPIVKEEELECLIDLAAKIYNTIRGNIVDAHMMFEKTHDWSVNPIMNILSERQKQFHEKVILSQQKK